METIFGLFSTYDQAQAAIRLLIEHRFRPEGMNVLVQDFVARDRLRGRLGRVGVAVAEMPPGLDRLVGGEKPLAIPDAGTILAGGDEATILANAAATSQSRSGGLGVVLREMGIPEPVAREFLAGLKGGGLLFWLKTEDRQAPEAADILREQKARHVGSYHPEPQIG